MLYSALEGHELTHMFIREQIEPCSSFLLAYITERQRASMSAPAMRGARYEPSWRCPLHHVLVTRLLRSSAWPVDDQAAVAAFAEFVSCMLSASRQAAFCALPRPAPVPNPKRKAMTHVRSRPFCLSELCAVRVGLAALASACGGTKSGAARGVTHPIPRQTPSGQSRFPPQRCRARRCR